MVLIRQLDREPLERQVRRSLGVLVVVQEEQARVGKGGHAAHLVHITLVSQTERNHVQQRWRRLVVVVGLGRGIVQHKIQGLYERIFIVIRDVDRVVGIPVMRRSVKHTAVDPRALRVVMVKHRAPQHFNIRLVRTHNKPGPLLYVRRVVHSLSAHVVQSQHVQMIAHLFYCDDIFV